MTLTEAPGTPWTGYGTGLVLSVAAHIGAAALVVTLLQPGPVTDQPPPKSELHIETQAVAQSEAQAQATQGDKAAKASAKGSEAAQGEVPQSKAVAAALPQTVAKAAQPDAPQARQTAAPAPSKATEPAAQTLAASAPDPQPLAATPPPPPVQALTPDTPPLPATAPTSEVATAATPEAQTLTATTATGEHVTATLAWSSLGGTIDPVSLKAIASFMQPGDAAAQADAVHDGLTAILQGTPCARMQAEFNPDTGSLDLRGHVPDAAMKGPILAALQAQLGSGIKVEDALMILPRPQCGALSGIADVGLPQSQDQLTNPRLIGPDAQARTFSYTKGEPMELQLAAPDYDAFVYVDFFDAGGNVIHLIPNDRVPLTSRPANSSFYVGKKLPDEPSLTITIGPPYGQEIAAAFAASAPLYDGVRPLSEPAGPYLDWLKTRVAEARARDKGFKGEWVYFMVSTKER